jgi:high affinity choline transporter 7
MWTQLDVSGLMVIIGTFALFITIGWWAARRNKGAESATDFLVAGRTMPLWIATMTMTATWVDGGFLLGTAEYTYKHGLSIGAQGGICLGVSLILGGLFFTKRIRELEHNTMVDIFEMRFGPRWAAVLSIPAMFGEIAWGGALLVAIGATLQVILHVELVPAILLSAGVVTLYTMIGGMWSIAYTDMIQLALVPIGLFVAIAYATYAIQGGWAHSWEIFSFHHQLPQTPALSTLLPSGSWHSPAGLSWWDMTLMLTLGGIPWNCYFQRVLSCSSPREAQLHSVFAGLLTMLITALPIVLGVLAFGHWGADGIKEASITLPLLLKELTPRWAMILGVVTILGAVTSSFSASILSAGSMFSWNVAHRLFRFRLDPQRFLLLARTTIFLLGLLAVGLALKVQSIASLWLFTSDLIFVILFPQLTMALFDPKSNLVGSIAGCCISLVLRIGGGLSLETDSGLIGFPALIPYPEMLSHFVTLTPSEWYDGIGVTLLPIKTFATIVGLIAIPAVSRLYMTYSQTAQGTAGKKTTPETSHELASGVGS